MGAQSVPRNVARIILERITTAKHVAPLSNIHRTDRGHGAAEHPQDRNKMFSSRHVRLVSCCQNIGREGNMSAGYQIRQTRQGEREPVCTHCKSKELNKAGQRNGKKRYICRTCKRSSYGLPPDLRPRCPQCKGTVQAMLCRDGRYSYRCPSCRFTFLSEYKIARREKSKERLRHNFTFTLNPAARARLWEYMQATNFREAQAVRAIFRHVLTGKRFLGCRGTTPRSRLLTRIDRNPAAAAMRFPNLSRENALLKLRHVERGGHYGGGFQHTIIGVHRLTVRLDDAAKEGLVYAMQYLNLNHADAARWLLRYAQIPVGKESAR